MSRPCYKRWLSRAGCGRIVRSASVVSNHPTGAAAVEEQWQPSSRRRNGSPLSSSNVGSRELYSDFLRTAAFGAKKTATHLTVFVSNRRTCDVAIKMATIALLFPFKISLTRLNDHSSAKRSNLTASCWSAFCSRWLLQTWA